MNNLVIYFRNEAALVNKNLAVQKLRKQINEAEENYIKVMRVSNSIRFFKFIIGKLSVIDLEIYFKIEKSR